MSDDPLARIRRFYDDAWGKGDLSVIDDLFAADYIRHDLRPGKPIPGPEGQKKITADFRAAFPDLQVTIDLMFGGLDLVTVRWTMTGTHTGAWGNVAPTGKRAQFSGVNIFRLSGGKVVEIWNHRDDLSLMQQLGVPIYAGAQ
jgi:steroid delta-isomerase-like uncharacterized protein